MLNKMTLQGRLTRDPELRTTQSGVSVASFTVAWSKKYKETETKLFLNCSAWRGTGELVSKYFVKGQEIIVEGELSTREYTDKDGNNRTVVEMTASEIHFCGPEQSERPDINVSADSVRTQPTAAPQPDYQAKNMAFGDYSEVDADDDLPF